MNDFISTFTDNDIINRQSLPPFIQNTNELSSKLQQIIVEWNLI